MQTGQQSNLQHNATSLSPSSIYYGPGEPIRAVYWVWDAHLMNPAGSPATISSPPVKTPQDGSGAPLQYSHNPVEANLPLFPSGVGSSTGSINPNRFNEYKHPQFHNHHSSLPPNFVYSQVAPSTVSPTAASNSSNAQPMTHGPAPTHELTINDFMAICTPQELEELRGRHNKLANNAELQMLHLRLMWQWYRTREKPKNDDLLKFHRAIRRSASTTARGTGSRGGAEGYTCLWPGCTKQDQPSRSDRAQEHTLLHLGLKPFRCADW
jgi:hypothetical protein